MLGICVGSVYIGHRAKHMNQVLIDSLWLVPLYPLIGAVAALPWFPGVIRRTGPRPAGYVNILLTLVAFLHSVWGLVEIWDLGLYSFQIPWLSVAGLTLAIPVLASKLTLGACVLVTGLNLLSQIYAVGYMEMDWGWARFFSLLGLFEAGMCALILCDSLFFSYMVLEILTLGTYLLIGFWYNQSLVVTGARDAFLTKRVGDLVLLMGVLAIYPLAGTWDFAGLAQWAETAAQSRDPWLLTVVGLALLAGPMGKCAQFPLHLWLDEAMEGPIPSTILRNSVVVATGAWVLIKLEPVIFLSPVAQGVAIAIGLITALGGALVALAQIDAKRALSYTVSVYMGVVFIAVGTHHSELALMLLFTYAVAMALMIMGVGGVIWNSITQDLTQLGGLWSRRPVSGIAYLVGAASLVALPPLGSFWVMAELVKSLWSHQPLLSICLILINALTALGVTREFSLIFGGKPRQMTERSPEIHWPMALPMMLLVGVALHVPHFLLAWGFLRDLTLATEPAGLILAASSSVGIILGGYWYLRPGRTEMTLTGSLAQLQDLLAQDFYTQRLYRASIVFGVDRISRLTDLVDRYLVDGLVNFVGLASNFSGEVLKYTTSGQFQLYMLTVLVGTMLVILFVLN